MHAGSGDKRLSHVVARVCCKDMAHSQRLKVRFDCAFPRPSGPDAPTGIPGAIWATMTQAAYNACRDPIDSSGLS